MKLKDVADLANLIAAVGVIISLLFLAYEVNQNTEESRAANRHDVATALRELTLARAQSPTLSTALAAVNSGLQLTPDQQAQYIAYFYAVIKSIEEAYFQYREGRLDEAYFESRVAGLMGPYFLSSEIGRNIFEETKQSGELTAEFVEVLDAKLAERNSE